MVSEYLLQSPFWIPTQPMSTRWKSNVTRRGVSHATSPRKVVRRAPIESLFPASDAVHFHVPVAVTVVVPVATPFWKIVTESPGRASVQVPLIWKKAWFVSSPLTGAGCIAIPGLEYNETRCVSHAVYPNELLVSFTWIESLLAAIVHQPTKASEPFR